MRNPDLERLASARHVNLTTFRADGSRVTTCMWIAREADALFAITHEAAGKVGRIRAHDLVELTPSDARGRPQGGGSSAHAAVLDDPASVRRAAALLRRKYGWQYRLLRSLMVLRGRGAGQPVAIRIVDPQPIPMVSPTGR